MIGFVATWQNQLRPLPTRIDAQLGAVHSPPFFFLVACVPPVLNPVLLPSHWSPPCHRYSSSNQTPGLLMTSKLQARRHAASSPFKGPPYLLLVGHVPGRQRFRHAQPTQRHTDGPPCLLPRPPLCPSPLPCAPCSYRALPAGALRGCALTAVAVEGAREGRGGRSRAEQSLRAYAWGQTQEVRCMGLNAWN